MESEPNEGALPGDAFASLGQRPFGVYVHVPWCSSRCGYCDFNTYVPGAISGAEPASFASDARAELREYQRRIRSAANGDLGATKVPSQPEVELDHRGRDGGIHRDGRTQGSGPAVSTVFFGGGTPTLLPAAELVSTLRAIDECFGLAADAEITTEANPESVDADYLSELRSGGFNRISIGMQSSSSRVLQTLDRTHTPGRATHVATLARDVGFDQVSLDLIYGTPGESDDEWQRSLDAAVEAEPTHISAYSLIVEDGTRMARLVRSGQLPAPDEDVLARRYEQADDTLSAAGFEWYEVSNWARPVDGSDSRCRHNLGYWHNDDWIGIGPGAHSHVGPYRWWNQKHPARCHEALTNRQLPIAGWELLDDRATQLEGIMLGMRLLEGLSVEQIAATRLHLAEEFVSKGLLDPAAFRHGQLVLTRGGRLLADHVIRELT